MGIVAGRIFAADSGGCGCPSRCSHIRSRASHSHASSRRIPNLGRSNGGSAVDSEDQYACSSIAPCVDGTHAVHRDARWFNSRNIDHPPDTHTEGGTIIRSKSEPALDARSGTAGIYHGSCGHAWQSGPGSGSRSGPRVGKRGKARGGC